ncbi:biotin transporter BioY [Aureimonas sp. AU12]|uniref:biotin transporter BioY n=1 Tax=Aureimonas sp. AU12 TaxID=1638161 RepID=UPI00078294B5|nr:biotin transporter BioY [Aureimonas sp. AU12]
MPISTSSLFAAPFGRQDRSAAWQVAAVVLGTLVLAASSHAEVPMVPVPITLQTLAVTLIGALYGWRLGAVTILAWLGQGALGFPVLAGGASGLHHFVGATGGYLLAFPIAGALTGWLVERGWNAGRIGLAFLAMLFGNMVCLALGAAWLAILIGGSQAIMLGVVPFLLGGLLKSALGAAVLAVLSRGPLRRRA